MARNRIVQMLLFALVMSAATAVVRAGDREFDAVVDHIRNEYHGKREGGFGLMIARMATHFAKPAGVKSFKFAIVDELSGPGDDGRLDRVLKDKLSPDWRPLVRVYSRKEREQTFVYARPNGDDMEVFVVTVDDEDATIIKARLDVDAVADWVAGNGDMFGSN